MSNSDANSRVIVRFFEFEFVWRWFMLQNSHHQLQRGVAVYNFYALIVTIRYISGRYVSEEVVHVNFPRRIPGL